MKLTFEEAAKVKVEELLQDGKVMVLDFDDGVGPFSNEGTCTLDLSFKLFIVDKSRLTADFDRTFDSDLGTIYYKGYSAEQMDENMGINLGKYLQFQLKGESGILDSNIDVVSL